LLWVRKNIHGVLGDFWGLGKIGRAGIPRTPSIFFYNPKSTTHSQTKKEKTPPVIILLFFVGKFV